MPKGKVPSIEERIKSHPYFKGYLRIGGTQDLIASGNERDRLRARRFQAINSMVITSDGTELPSPVSTAIRWVTETRGTLRDHGLQTLAYWDVLIDDKGKILNDESSTEKLKKNYAPRIDRNA